MLFDQASHDGFGLLRLGPSASQIGMVSEERASQLVGAITVLKDVLSEPWAQGLFQSMGLGVVGSHSPREIDDTRDGKPASSKPHGAPSEAMPPPSVPVRKELPVAKPETNKPETNKPETNKPETNKPETKPDIKPEPAHEPTPPTVDTTTAEPPQATPVEPTPPSTPSADARPTADANGSINSSTHRASHARLARRVQALSEAECPNVTKLWNGTRKDL